jgi:hypothetical protein
MRKWVKFFKNLKSLKKLSVFSKYFIKHSKKSYLEKPKAMRTQKIFTAGNIEFSLFFSSVIFMLYYINKHKHSYNETVRLIGAGISTHIIVDVITYLGDKINTKVKVESFYIKKSTSFKDINYFFDRTFFHYRKEKQFKRHRTLNQKSLGNYLGDLHFRGIQPAMVFVVLNSIVFYGSYKNLKYFLKEYLGIDGFFNFFTAAAIAQLMAMIFAFPLENIKTRMQASNFSYDSLFKYYRKLIKGKPLNVIVSNLKNEYSGFVSHLLLYVVYESVTFGIYETMMKLKIFKRKNDDNETNNNNSHDINFYAVVIASCFSGFIAAVVTNPIDVYQINKQINPNFSTSQLNRWNILTGMKERIIFITFLNLATFLSLESIGPKYFDVRLE